MILYVLKPFIHKNILNQDFSAADNLKTPWDSQEVRRVILKLFILLVASKFVRKGFSLRAFPKRTSGLRRIWNDPNSGLTWFLTEALHREALAKRILEEIKFRPKINRKKKWKKWSLILGTVLLVWLFPRLVTVVSSAIDWMLSKGYCPRQKHCRSMKKSDSPLVSCPRCDHNGVSLCVAFSKHPTLYEKNALKDCLDLHYGSESHRIQCTARSSTANPLRWPLSKLTTKTETQ